MPYKVFDDPDGISWEVWLVRPSSTERRSEEGEAKFVSSVGGGAARSGSTERRLSDSGPRSVLKAGFENGWLCFESRTGEKRRLTPVPEGWETATTEKLWLWCRAAREVPRCEPG